MKISDIVKETATAGPAAAHSKPKKRGKLVGETEQMSEATPEETALQSRINKMMVAAEQIVKMLERSRKSIDSVGGDSSYIDDAVAKAKDLESALEEVERGAFGHLGTED